MEKIVAGTADSPGRAAILGSLAWNMIGASRNGLLGLGWMLPGCALVVGRRTG